ncbi:Phenoloxidase-activating factor 3, partial [Gryllus bimaculatus]
TASHFNRISSSFGKPNTWTLDPNCNIHGSAWPFGTAHKCGPAKAPDCPLRPQPQPQLLSAMALRPLLLAALCLGAARAVVFEGGDPFREDAICSPPESSRPVGLCKRPHSCPVNRDGSWLPNCGLPGADANMQCCAHPSLPHPQGGRRSRRACLQFTKAKQHCDFQPPAAGSEVRIGDFPYFAGLGYKTRTGDGKTSWACGGALISENFVLTAANCARGSPSFGAPAKVRLGAVTFREGEGAGPDAQELDVAQVILHPAYNASSTRNDIALLRLADSARLTRAVYPACLFPETRLPIQRVVLAGAGARSAERNVGKLSKVDLPVVPFEKCQDIYKNSNTYIDELTTICAGEKGRDACVGDSGAPVVQKEAAPLCNYQIVGITSFGFRQCGSQPAVYTKVQAFLPWIEETVWGRTTQLLSAMALRPLLLASPSASAPPTPFVFEDGAPFREEAVCAPGDSDRPSGACKPPGACPAGGKDASDCGLPGADLRCCALPASSSPLGGERSRQGYKTKSGNQKTRWHCGGALISENFVLTAAHCARGSSSTGSPDKVRLGGVSLSEDAGVGADEQELDVAEILVHPAYNASSVSNNIALLRLSGNARLTRAVQPACLFPEAQLPVGRLVLAGHGARSTDAKDVGTLSKVDLPVVPFEKCKEIYEQFRKNIDQSTTVCAGEKGRDACVPQLLQRKEHQHAITRLLESLPLDSDNVALNQQYTRKYRRFYRGLKKLYGVKINNELLVNNLFSGQDDKLLLLEKYCSILYRCRSTSYFKFIYEKFMFVLCLKEIKIIKIVDKESNAFQAFNQLPGAAGLGYKTKSGNGKTSWLCGGALISDNYVLTAANCAHGTPSLGGPVRVRLGGVSLSEDAGEDAGVGADEQELDVAEILQQQQQRLVAANDYPYNYIKTNKFLEKGFCRTSGLYSLMFIIIQQISIYAVLLKYRFEEISKKERAERIKITILHIKLFFPPVNKMRFD